MEERQLGRPGIKVSAMGMGGSAIGGPFSLDGKADSYMGPPAIVSRRSSYENAQALGVGPVMSSQMAEIASIQARLSEQQPA
jgi:hypothetical protein